MFFKYHCSTNCDLSIEPSAAIYLNDLQDASQITKLENIHLIFSFSEIETREFREIKEVSTSFNETNRPRYGQTLKSVVDSISKIEILN